MCRALQSPYDLLGLPRGTSKSDTRKFFRKLAQTEHPDVNPTDPRAAERFQELVGAYNDIMGDELLPDELLELRVQNTKRYQVKIGSEVQQGSGLMFMGNARLIQGIVTVLFFATVFAVGTLPPDVLESVLSPPQGRF